MKEDFLSGFYGAARLFVDLVRAPFLVIRAFILHEPRPGATSPSPMSHVEHRGRRPA
jgi:hypothetical protein